MLLGRLKPIRQVQLPKGRPDILFASDTGHLLVVEVKLHDNSDLKGRKVLAQVIDYAATLAGLTDGELHAALSKGHRKTDGLAELYASWFPDLADPASAAQRFSRRVRAGDVHLVLACDRLPPGIFDWAEQTARLSALPFEFRAVEVTPHVPKNADGSDRVLFVPTTRVEALVVSRTVVEVHQPVGDAPVPIKIAPPRAEEVEQAVKSPRGKNPAAKKLLQEAIELAEPGLAAFETTKNVKLRGLGWVCSSRCFVLELNHHNPEIGKLGLDFWIEELVDREAGVRVKFAPRGRGTRNRVQFARDAADEVAEALRTAFGVSIKIEARSSIPIWCFPWPTALGETVSAAGVAELVVRGITAISTVVALEPLSPDSSS